VVGTEAQVALVRLVLRDEVAHEEHLEPADGLAQAGFLDVLRPA
jgi:hypothetical protein